jgi:hypothetical protein
MRIVGIGGSLSSASVTRRGEDDAHEPGAPGSESRAVIAVEAAAASEHPPQVTRHPAAGFLTQLIATRMRAPQTRVRGRADPEEATAVYRSMTKPVPYRRAFGKRA